MRHAEELSITIAPASAIRGESSREAYLPAAISTMSTPQ